MAGNHDDPDLDAEGIPDLETPISDDEGIISPGDTPIAADEWGVTAAQERLDEPIAERVTREVPDLRANDIDLDLDQADDADDADEDGFRMEEGTTARFVDPADRDVSGYDDEKDVIASLVGDDGAPSAEEAAMHITDQP